MGHFPKEGLAIVPAQRKFRAVREDYNMIAMKQRFDLPNSILANHDGTIRSNELFRV